MVRKYPGVTIRQSIDTPVSGGNADGPNGVIGVDV